MFLPEWTRNVFRPPGQANQEVAEGALPICITHCSRGVGSKSSAATILGISGRRRVEAVRSRRGVMRYASKLYMGKDFALPAGWEHVGRFWASLGARIFRSRSAKPMSKRRRRSTASGGWFASSCGRKDFAARLRLHAPLHRAAFAMGARTGVGERSPDYQTPFPRGGAEGREHLSFSLASAAMSAPKNPSEAVRQSLLTSEAPEQPNTPPACGVPHKA
jgi:hypothetical protein